MSTENGKEKKPFTVKGFFKSTSFKCIAVLLAIVLISGILLTICNSLFYVSEAERLQRVLSSVYGREVTATAVALDQPNISDYENALSGTGGQLVRTKYIDTDNTSYTTSGDSVTFNIVTTEYSRAGAFTINVTVGEGGVIIAYEIVENGSTPPSFADRMPENVKDGSLFKGKNESGMLEVFPENGMTPDGVDDTLSTGATQSNFLCTYGALFALSNYEAILGGAAIDETLEYTQYIDLENTKATAGDGEVTYTIVTTDYSRAGAFTINITVRGGFTTSYTGGTVNSVYYIEDDGNYLVNATGTGGFSGGTVTCWVVVNMTDGAVSGVGRVVIDSNSGQSYINKVNRDDVLSEFEGEYSEGEDASAWTGTGATMSLTAITGSVNTALSFVRSELASGGASNPLAGYRYTDYINAYSTTISAEGSNVNYTVVTTAAAPAQSFTIDITVGAGGVITAYNITTNGSTSDKYINNMPANVKDGTLYVGKNSEAIRALLGGAEGDFGPDDLDDTLQTNATFLCTYAALFASANYEMALTAEGGAN